MPRRTRHRVNILPIISSIVFFVITGTAPTSPLLLAAAASSSSSPTAISPSSIGTPTITSNEKAKQQQEKMDTVPKYIVFSDVDGTLVHYPRHLQQQQRQQHNHNNENDTSSSPSSSNDNPLIFLPPSKTGTRGVLSKRTLELCHQIRHGRTSLTASTATNQDETATPSLKQPQPQQLRGRTPFILVSGMRTTTLFQRLPYLPRADAYVSESGGRIFYPRTLSTTSEPTARNDGAEPHLVVHSVFTPSENDGDNDDIGPFTLVEDMEWRRQMSELHAAGPDGFHNASLETPLEERRGKLWEYALHLIERGYILDTNGYSTAFRVNRKMQDKELLEGFDEFMEKCATRQDMPKELGCSTNLGCVDVYPIRSGKKNCCAYLARRFLGQNSNDDDDNTHSSSSLLQTHAFCLCDDDNDIEMALACRTAFLPSVTSDSIRKRVEMQSDDGNGGMQRHGRLVVTEDVEGGVVETRATERALEMIMKELNQASND
ncbi:hypothetical protein HJC23_006017 [Cyclotella cryptica]|uniref:Sucrose phosphatase-like domain-containing protein n=1 Tax=Cyclotella cryptica TaxID=29204 RepID=A0ABD3P4J2_9STRA|eukprot:CCRYP_017886-RA/>CCRYP_017886-RA protein AED:0.42 eAED:0.42 QI:0/-1/0/1/-1/1/1/0/488